MEAGERGCEAVDVEGPRCTGSRARQDPTRVEVHELGRSGAGSRRIPGGKGDKVPDVSTSTITSLQRDEMKELYSLEMPEDLYHFWDFCKELCPDNPRALTDTLGLQLVGPFDVLAGAHKKLKTKPNLNLHCRYFYDPPEFQTIIRSDCSQLHFGYYSLYIQRKKKEKGSQKPDLESLEEKLQDKAEILGFSLEQKTKDMKQRDKKVVTKTFHGAGIVVPVDKNDVGYRELPETDAALKKICKAIAEAKTDEERIKAFGPIQEMITFVQFANDECDYGMGYELGMDLFCYGSHYFHKIIKQLLPLAYNLLKRSLFGEIVEAHLSNRSQEPVDQLAN
uniref:Histone PARylation factor 1 n=1 Tax=Periophthalmus magnuspinnatus TaxID=409849 RepID=A0A3B4BJI6_9GOBI